MPGSHLRSLQVAGRWGVAESTAFGGVILVWFPLPRLLMYIPFTLCWLYSWADCLFGSEMSARIFRFKSHQQPYQKAHSHPNSSNSLGVQPNGLWLGHVSIREVVFVAAWSFLILCWTEIRIMWIKNRRGIFLHENLGCHQEEKWG